MLSLTRLKMAAMMMVPKMNSVMMKTVMLMVDRGIVGPFPWPGSVAHDK
jgi:hypothetical protein